MFSSRSISLKKIKWFSYIGLLIYLISFLGVYSRGGSDLQENIDAANNWALIGNIYPLGYAIMILFSQSKFILKKEKKLQKAEEEKKKPEEIKARNRRRLGLFFYFLPLIYPIRVLFLSQALTVGELMFDLLLMFAPIDIIWIVENL